MDEREQNNQEQFEQEQEIPTPSPNVPVAETPITKSPSSNKLTILLISVLVLLLGVGGYFFFLQKEISSVCVCPDGSTVDIEGTDCELIECPGVQDETANWQTYRNEEYGFEFRYPQDWELFINAHGSGASLLVSLDPEGLADSHVDTDLPYSLDINVYTNISQLDYKNFNVSGLTDFIQQYSSGNDPKLVDVSLVSIGGKDGYKAGAGPNVFGGGSSYYVENLNMIYEFEFFSGESNQILSTFKFIEQ